MDIRHMMRLFHRKARREGLFSTLKFSVKKLTGILQHERELDTLHYIINHCIDITKIPPASGAFRKYQLCALSILKTFDAICKKYGWTYWLYAGTLLGAVRHKGFIPWDDDIDVAMPRKDYDEAIKKLPEICRSYGSDSLTLWGDLVTGGLQYSPAGVRIDLFPCDEIYSGSDSGDESEDRKLIAKKLKKYRSFFYAHTRAARGIKPDDVKAITNERDNIFYAGGGGGTKYIVHNSEFIFAINTEKIRVQNYDTVFPLSTVQFEGFTFPAPADTDKYLTEHFGNYMSFPRDGAIHHIGSTDSLRRKDFDALLERLQAIEKFFTSQS